MWDPKKLDTSKYPKLDNYYYKQLLTAGSNDIILQRELTSDAGLKTLVEKFAQDQKAYHTAFSQAFVKLTNLGHDADSLTNVEELLVDHPYQKFIHQYY